ncbi:MAG: thiol-disulfide oxidoreductase, partial [Gemmataceae bacterium]|nr:thiol-disulfide oxidoreductase [Gemmataceae bacterium]
TDDPPAAVAKWVAEYKIGVPVYLDPKRAAVAAVGAKVTPEAAVLDAEGVLRYRGRIDDGYSARLKKNPAVTSFDLKDALAAVLAGKPVRTPTTTAVGCPIDTDTASVVKGEVTYHKDVAPILQKHCQGCHRPGEVGPFPLTTYKQARRWAADIKTFTASREMPPWMPAAGLRMRGERKLAEGEISTLAKWEEAGCPEGDAGDAPPPVQYPDGWRLGKPDLVLSPSEDFHLGPTGKDVFRCFVMPTGLAEHQWVVGYDVRPGNPRVVHHTLHFFDGTGQGRELERKQQLKEKGTDAADRGPGYPVSMGVGFAVAPTTRGDVPRFGGVGGWAPGQVPHFLPTGAGWRLPKGSDFLIQAHYHRDGKPGTDRTQVGLYFAKGPIDQPWQTIVVDGMKPGETIPAGETAHVSRGALYLRTDAILHSVLPHMHLLGRRVKVTMTPPGGKPVVLVEIPAWDYRWQETYWFREPVAAAAGTRLEIEAVFDNSVGNPNNPTNPPREVKVGEQTTDEMLFGFIGATSTKTPWEKIRTSGFPPPELGAVAAPMKGELTPVLERRLGVWDNAVVIRPLLGEETRLSTTDTVEKAFGGTFLHFRSVRQGDANDLTQLVTHDPARQVYRMWTDSAQGAVVAWEGTWDEKAETLTWKANLQTGLTGVMKWKFVGDDRMELELAVRSGFAPVMTLNSTMTRKK